MQKKWKYKEYEVQVGIPVIANSCPKHGEQVSEGWRTGVRVMPNSRSEATLSFNTISNNIR